MNEPATQTGPVHAENQASSAFGSARSYADLSTGKIGAESSLLDPSPFFPGPKFAMSGAGWSDVLIFTLPDDNPNPVINFSYLVDGTLEPDPDGCSGCNYMGYNFGITEINDAGSSTGLFGGGAAVFYPTLANAFQPTPYLASFGTIATFDRNGITGSFTPKTGYTYLFNANIVTGGNSSFYNTATFRLPSLPPGVTFTSESGVFLSAAAAGVPEPATWAMMLVGFGLVGFAMRKRSSVSTTVSYA